MVVVAVVVAIRVISIIILIIENGGGRCRSNNFRQVNISYSEIIIVVITGSGSIVVVKVGILNFLEGVQLAVDQLQQQASSEAQKCLDATSQTL